MTEGNWQLIAKIYLLEYVILAISFIVFHSIFWIASLSIYFPFLSQFMFFSSFGHLVFFSILFFVSFDLIVFLLVEISLNYRSYGLNIYLNILKPCVCLIFIWVHLLFYSSNKSKKNFIYFFPKTLIPNKETWTIDIFWANSGNKKNL